ncbi:MULTISPECIES: DUF58 domain-containing protein [unclassified Lentimicrobium]|uniref:DUF58 domain-containing protein n=1 Tax=unclassified Lentimicrobium TaxID=2677434 RepID=UPI0015558996|nr:MULTISPECIES: DUF58 domain-containing protein [unclassified Lentimicrobium]NPD44142.1 DUF58 domain-containing protein [Lentimicrobium sp. S6]NPD83264.1 DUF58 domain-containing protein [Lentimicrobium sp. L6]
MTAKEIFKKVRKIEIKTRGLSNQIFAGQYHSSFKGRGMAFSEVREYQYGDDVRNIDWNVTARFNHPFIKIFEEEREMTVMLLIDVSASHQFGTVESFKQDVLTEISAVLAFSAIKNNDKVGVIFFSDKIEKFIPPKKGSTHILRIIRELVDFKAESKGTDVSEALKFLTNAIKKRCTAFVLSDFKSPNFKDALKIASNKHDLMAVRIFDQRENEIPNVGLIQVEDSETGETKWIDTASAAIRRFYADSARKNEILTKETFKKSGVDLAEISTGTDYVKPLVAMFKKREARA